MAETTAPKKSPATKAKKPAAPKKPKTAKPEPSTTKFAKAIEEARAGAVALQGETLARAGAYRDQINVKSAELIDEAKAIGDQAKERATELAYEGKAKASEAIAGLGQIVEENAAAIDEKLGEKYGDYARKAGRTMQDTAKKIDAKDLGELGEDAKEFVRKSPGLAIGIAAAAGFILSRFFKKSED